VTTHALLSPSGSHKWLACPGSVAMEYGLPDTSSEYSDEGTCAHEVAADCLITCAKATHYIGKRIDLRPGKTYEFTADMAEPVQAYVDYVNGQVEAYKLAGATATLSVEVKVPIGHITGEEGATGTCDASIVATFPDGKREYLTVDLKFGRGVAVSAQRNPQGMIYTLGVINQLSGWDDLDAKPDTPVRIVIHQPRLGQPSEWVTTIKELWDWCYDVQKNKAPLCHEALKAKDDLPTLEQYLMPGEHCSKGFCKARATCPALANYVKTWVGADFEDLTKAAPEAPANDSDAGLSAKMAATDIIDDWCRAVRAEVERRLLAGKTVTGWKLVQGKKGNRAWADKTLVEQLLKGMRLKQDEMYEFSLISPTTAEKLLKETPKRWAKVESHITRAEGKPSVAPESDKRPALVIAPPLDDFADVTADVSDLL